MNNQLKVSIGQYSNKGVKEINQDFHDIRIPAEPQLTNKGIAIAIADGISSSQVSQEASKVSVTSFLEDYFCTSESWSVKKSASTVLKATNSWLYTKNRQDKYHLDKDKGYVCTFSTMIIKSTTAYILHLGDVRIYRLRDNNLEQLTTDHRVYISEDKSYLSRAMGIDSVLNPDYETFEVEKDDIYLFMTDGVYEFLSDSFIKETLNKSIDDYDHVAKKFIYEALKNNSDDNLTIQIVKVDDIPDKNVEETHKQLTFRPLPPILQARMNFDGYNIIRELSHSSRSHIYLAKDEETKKDVVIKIPSVELKDDKSYLERFMMEEWIARRISSPYVVKSYLQTRKRNYLYNVTEFIEGQTLTKWMIDNPNTKIDEVRNIAEQIAKGLNSFHKQEMIHQDLRPENIMIDKINTIKVIDFGATKVEGILEINTTIEHENLQGTALYSAPEYFLGEEGTSKSDIFSLGVIVYQMISGSFPYGTNVAKCTNKASQNKLIYNSLYPSVPIWIDEAIKKSVAIDPNKRYDHLTEFIYDLKKPNKKFLNKKRPPLIERSPEKFWQGISFILLMIILFLIIK